MAFPDLLSLIPANLRSVASFLPGLRGLAENNGKTIDAIASVILPGVASLLPAHEQDAVTLDNLHEIEGVVATAAVLIPQCVALEQRVQALAVKIAGELAS